MIKKIFTGITVTDVLAVGGAMIGSILVALNIGMGLVGYIFYMISAVASVYILVKHDSPKSMILMNGFYIVVNVIGIIRFMS